ncbi:HAMP domain-containing sensor histidine kinase [Streptomyces sp. ActVer]|uniref:sensor histidine kinase n=1 Tax=Streptomyces sp. ActVer TaxID=3014558 RepID=UPI0022B42CA0|nr:HAMP domain-containing sensor histidine kinase [Streptomyces sp. ActVer]MCZ4508114.1 HAMP domain-containing sensor histidine kinase [Streptomyces sp. ActVer]
MSPAVARLRRTRRLMTLLFASATAACLVVLAVVAVRIDSQSRRSGLDHEVGSRAVGLSRAVWFDAGVLHLEPLREDELARSAEVLAVLQAAPGESPSVRNVVPARSALPGRDRLDDVWRSVLEEQGTVVVSAPSVDGGRLKWAAAPVWDGDRIGAAVLVGTELARSERDHDVLVRWLALGCTALVCCAAAVGHLLSGRAMRPALRGLARQEQFLAEAAHELRTPLATLRLVVERDSSSGASGSSASSDEALRLVDRLSRLVTGLLARARLESGAQRAELVPLRLDQLVETTVEELPDHESVTVSTEPVVVLGDPDLLAEAVRNLVANAQRHGGPAGSPVEVTVTPGLVAVRDHGAGVPPADRERVFGRGVTGGFLGRGSRLAIEGRHRNGGRLGNRGRPRHRPLGRRTASRHRPPRGRSRRRPARRTAAAHGRAPGVLILIS